MKLRQRRAGWRIAAQIWMLSVYESVPGFHLSQVSWCSWKLEERSLGDKRLPDRGGGAAYQSQICGERRQHKQRGGKNGGVRTKMIEAAAWTRREWTKDVPMRIDLCRIIEIDQRRS